MVEGVLAMIAKLPVDLKGAAVASLRRGVIFADPFAHGDPRVRLLLHNSGVCSSVLPVLLSADSTL